MDKKYVERSKVLSKLKYVIKAYVPSPFLKERLMKCVTDIPAADVQEVRHGSWVHCINNRDPRDDFYNCSVCGRTINLNCDDKITNYPYCHCGARMDGDPNA